MKFDWQNTILLTLLLLGIGFAAYLIFDQTGVFEPNNVAVPTQTVEPTPTVTVRPTPRRSSLPSGWNRQEFEEIGLSIALPSDIETEIQDRNNSLQITKWGPTQEENTEFYDGISLNILAGELGQQSLMEIAESSKTEFENEPVVESVSEITEIEIGEFSGYQFSVTSLGTREYYFIEDMGKYFQVTNSTVDPTNQGFEETAMEIIATLEVL